MAIELNKNINLVIRVRLIGKGDNEPITGSEYKVRLYDKDIFADDYLGESLMEEGVASFTITPESFRAPLGLDEKPDFYFLVYKNDQMIFKSRVMQNIDISNFQEFVMKEGEVIDLGTYLIDEDM